MFFWLCNIPAQHVSEIMLQESIFCHIKILKYDQNFKSASVSYQYDDKSIFLQYCKYNADVPKMHTDIAELM